MSTDFKIENDILIITVVGKWSGDNAGHTHGMVSNFLKSQGVTNIILDAREALLDASTWEIFEVTSQHADIFPAGTRHAIIVSSDSTITDDIKFGQNVASNRGLKMKTFHDMNSAIKWLKDGKD
jgi:hypothetical protein